MDFSDIELIDCQPSGVNYILYSKIDCYIKQNIPKSGTVELSEDNSCLVNLYDVITKEQYAELLVFMIGDCSHLLMHTEYPVIINQEGGIYPNILLNMETYYKSIDTLLMLTRLAERNVLRCSGCPNEPKNMNNLIYNILFVIPNDIGQYLLHKILYDTGLQLEFNNLLDCAQYIILRWENSGISLTNISLYDGIRLVRRRAEIHDTVPNYGMQNSVHYIPMNDRVTFDIPQQEYISQYGFLDY